MSNVKCHSFLTSLLGNASFCHCIYSSWLHHHYYLLPKKGKRDLCLSLKLVTSYWKMMSQTLHEVSKPYMQCYSANGNLKPVLVDWLEFTSDLLCSDNVSYLMISVLELPSYLNPIWYVDPTSSRAVPCLLLSVC